MLGRFAGCAAASAAVPIVAQKSRLFMCLFSILPRLFHSLPLARGRVLNPRVCWKQGGFSMETTVRYLGNQKFEAETRGHTILSDQPAENHGDDCGMTPPELMLASLGTCAGYYAAEYLRVRHLPAAGLQVRVEADKALKPARLSAFRVTLTAPNLDGRHRDGVLRAVQSCLIHSTLTHQPVFEFALETVAPEPGVAGLLHA